ncbi:MAG: lipoprotein [Pedosphaera sp.]|nr:lipoprotein [Pedosphaera sp.]
MSVRHTEVPDRPVAIRQSYKERLFHKILNWSEKPGSFWALFFVSLVQSALFPLPTLLLFFTLSLGAVRKTFRFALVCSIGSILGGMLAYTIGFTAWDTVKSLFIPHLFSEQFLIRAEAIYGKNIFLATLATSIAPISYQVCSIAAGVLKVNFWHFLLASCVARPLRFFSFALLVHFFGERAKRFIEGHLSWVTWLIVILLLLAGGGSLLYRLSR